MRICANFILIRIIICTLLLTHHRVKASHFTQSIIMSESQSAKDQPSSQTIATQMLAKVVSIFDDHIPFNQLLGLKIKRYDLNGVEVMVAMKPELIGNIHHNILHGGVTASVLDVVGSLTAFSAVVASRDDWQPDQLKARLRSLSTIDMRVDYLRPGRGEMFVGTGQVIRSGNKVSVCRMELHNEDNEHIAFGTGTYMVG